MLADKPNWYQPNRFRTMVAAAALGAAMLVPVAGAQSAHATATHVANPYVGSTPYLNPDYVSEVKAQAAADGGTNGAAEASVAGYQTAIWMDHIGAITGDSTHLSLQAQLNNAEAQSATSTEPVLFEVVIYDLPGRDCAALASNGEIPATAAGLTEYESQYIDPIAALLGSSSYSNLRISAIIEPDSLPNAVTNQSKPACATATPYYEAGIEYALNMLHPISNLYTYLDIGHSGWLGWPSNMTPAAQEYAKVAKATTAGFASVDGFISDTANYTPTDEPYLPNSTLQVGGSPLDSVNFYQYNPYFDEHTYDEAMHTALVTAGFPSTVGMLIDTSRDGWGGSARPTALNTSPTTATAYVAANKIDQRPFRGDWCNIAGAGIGSRPTVQPYGASDPVIAFVWIKPPGESDGDYPTSTHAHGDPHCDPNGTQTDGNGNTYPTDAIPGYDVPAGQWFAAEFQQLVTNAYPSLGTTTGGGGGDTTAPSVPGGLTVTGATSSSVSLSWAASTDNVGVTGYDVYRNGTLAGTVTSGTSYTDTGLTASTAYSYTVKAFDAAGNLSAASTAVTGSTSAPSGGGTGSSGCTAAYTISSDWGAGFNANVTVTNTGPTPTKTWTVTWTWPGNQQITNLWNGSYTQTGSSVTVTNAGYNNVIAAGGNTSFGFGGTYSGTNTAPTPTCTTT